MRTISEDFREALRGIRELNALITYQSESVSYAITTELGQGITTELSEILSTELGDVVYEGEQIISLNPLCEVELFKTICKSVTVQTRNEIPVNTWINVKIGVLVNNAYEFLDFGDYYVTESKYEADTNSYNITAYDRMLEAMVPYDLTATYPITIKNLLIAIFTKLGWEYELDTFINQDKTLTKDLFSNQNLTFRDVLDNISQVIVGNIGFDGKVAKIKYISPLESSTQIPFEIPQTLNVGNITEDRYITEEDLKDTNVTLNKKYGPLNSIVVTQNDVVLDNLQDSASVEVNGLTEYKFDNNLILMNDSDTFITDMFNGIKGLEYYLYDFDTIGKLCYEPLDEVVVKIGEDEYKTLILNDDIKLTQGLEETMYADIPTETTPEYIAIDKTEKKINNALISIDKANAEIVLKVDSQGRLAQVSLDGDADEGTSVNISANSIGLEGETIDLTAKNINLVGDITAGSKIELTDALTQEGYQQFEITRGNYELTAYSDSIEIGETRNIPEGNSIIAKANLFAGKSYMTNPSDPSIHGYYQNYEFGAALWNVQKSGINTSMNINHGLYIHGDILRGSRFRFDDGNNAYLQIYNGVVSCSEPFYPSDKRLKENIKDVKVDWIDKLKVKEFNYIKTPKQKEIGLIAQDYLKEDFGDYFIGIYEDKCTEKKGEEKDEERYAIRYQTITNALIQYCQELKKQVNDLEARIEKLEGNDK